MNQQTIVAVYDTAAHAEAAVSELKAAHVPAEAISQHSESAASTGETTTVAPAREQGFWSSLFGGEPDHDTSLYTRSIANGGTVVTVKVPSEEYDRVSEILEKHDPIDLDERAAAFSSTQAGSMETSVPVTGATATGNTAATGGDKIELAEETLAVGKRAVSGGTTRIRRYVVETPIEEQVSLHSEKVTLDRRPVTDARPVANPEFTDKTIEMTETSEEAVVAKTARVKEEISLRKEVSDRVETVKDTVRHDEVKVEQVPGTKTETTSATTPIPMTPKPVT